MKIKGNFSDKIEDLAGLSRSKPLLAFSFLIILFSLAGIPPLGGFFAKFYVFISVIESDMYFLAIVGLLTTVISAFYYLRIIKIIYFDEAKTQFDQTKNFNALFVILLSCLFLITYFAYPFLLNNIIDPIFIY